MKTNGRRKRASQKLSENVGGQGDVTDLQKDLRELTKFVRAVVEEHKRGERVPKSKIVGNPEAKKALQVLRDNVLAMQEFDLRTFRLKVGASQEALARAARVPTRSLIRWERAEAMPRIESLKKFCDNLLGE